MTTARPALAGLTVLVPRARDQASQLSALLRARGAEPLEVPTIEIRPVLSTAELDRAIQDLTAGRHDWVVLTSVNGVAALRARAEGRVAAPTPSAGPGWPPSARPPRPPCAAGGSSPTWSPRSRPRWPSVTPSLPARAACCWPGPTWRTRSWACSCAPRAGRRPRWSPTTPSRSGASTRRPAAASTAARSTGSPSPPPPPWRASSAATAARPARSPGRRHRPGHRRHGPLGRHLGRRHRHRPHHRRPGRGHRAGRHRLNRRPVASTPRAATPVTMPAPRCSRSRTTTVAGSSSVPSTTTNRTLSPTAHR